jgi:hypothetical protein
MKKLFLPSFLLFLSAVSFAGGATGMWRTIDDETDKPKSIVLVYEEDGKQPALLQFNRH